MTHSAAIIQSNYIPWKGYIDVIRCMDTFVIFDSVQYTRRDWRNRNKIKSPTGLQWLTIPVEVKGKYEQKICETRIADSNWAKEHLMALVHNYSKAQCFEENIEWLKSLYGKAGELEYLSDVNYLFLTEVCLKLGITTPLRKSDEFDLCEGKTERLVTICKQGGFTKYFSGPADQVYLDESLFAAEGIEVEWIKYPRYPEYPQLFPPFEHAVSILDVILNCGSAAAAMLDGETKILAKAEMKDKKLLIVGTGRFAELALIYFAKYSEYEPVAFCLDKEYLECDEHMGVPVVPFEDVQTSHPPDSYWLFIGIGYTQANKTRAKKYYEAKEKGYRLATFISPHVVMVDENTPIGDNTFIFEGQVIQPGVSIGSDVIIWSGNHLGHDATIHDHAFITSHVVLAGYSTVGEYSFVGVNAAIRDTVKVGKNCIIGAGCTILKNTKDNEVYVDNGSEKYPMDTDTFVRRLKI